MTHSAVYVKYELLRTFRNRRFIFLSLGFPLVLYFLIAGPNRNDAQPRQVGHLGAALLHGRPRGLRLHERRHSAGARIAAERAVGWNRQLRLTPLSTRMYFRTKVLTGYVMALCTLALLYIAGTTLGVHLSAGALGADDLVHPARARAVRRTRHPARASPERRSIGPSIGGMTALFSILGGVWFPITSGTLHDIAQALPSYWLVQAAHVGLGGNGWGARGWLIDGVWTAALAAIAVRVYRRDTGRN